MTTTTTPTLTAIAQEILERILSLRRVTHETNTVTRRSQGMLLQSLGDTDLIEVSRELARHQAEYAGE
jgi:hypothetical protein